MNTLLLTHPDCLEHETPKGHPERVDRLRAINQILAAPHFQRLDRLEAPRGLRESVLLAHEESYVSRIEEAVPSEGMEAVDPDTWLSPRSLDAALRGVGAATRAVDAVFNGEAVNAFCATRPPGHHAESDKAMGFCFFNNAAIAALHARENHNAQRVAVVDFDVHHGNGTQEIFWSDRDLFYGSTHQMPLFPGTGEMSETGVGNIVNAPLRAGDGSDRFREAMMSTILPALDAFEPDLIVVSAGFDAHRDDPLGSLQLSEEDFIWITLRLLELADQHCEGRLVSVLEGGYDLRALASSVGCHVQTLMRAAEIS
ncbi:acetoin utilization deacetylase AcuC-like enzyme [Rhodoligotrophos appendicifer]|uniref:histone deacetylase family protein n=1 Tax=Rhodoligotrophos appendicifer TaxID=987056 RepID=UPI00118698B3|nr:histone deacetylase family protein [Rhodoligotrophos appendicifer]